MNPINVVNFLADLVKASVTTQSPSDITEKEKAMARHLFDIINSFNNSKNVHYEEETTLDIEIMSDHGSSDDEAIVPGGRHNENDDEWKNEEHQNEKHELKRYSLEYMEEVIAYADETDETGKRRHSWKSIHHRFKALPNQGYVARFRKYLENRGTKQQKTHSVDKIVYEKFVYAREHALPIHDMDIQRWGLKAAKELDLENFHASHGWLAVFKQRHGIVSRRVTNIITRHEIENSDEVEKSKKEFLLAYNKVSSKYTASQVINTDQSGVEKELHSTRTLSTKGEKKTFGIVASKNASTHSYTLQPSITLDGEVLGPVLLCLQEVNGKMGEIVKKNLFRPANVVITCSSSGKLTSSLVTYWKENCLLPYISNKCLLLSDSWSGQRDPKHYHKKNCNGKDIFRLEIPPKTTSDLQPLDCFYNRQMKNFIKKLYNRVALDEIDIHLYERNNIIKLTSLVHDQLSAPVFRPMIKYSWFVAGLLKQNPSPFLTVNEVCFPPISGHEQCQSSGCEESVMINCAHCSKKLCFEHFFVLYHFHG